ncbi:hypothetical protein [Methylocucumis oryzae]|uniref:hypothetical protein n=1 Tax=Methylocucumis oryzae TaxID=1632867 RepID=UPI00103D2204|nr:hypothetical protein [Methylocucumis oryzae]
MDTWLNKDELVGLKINIIRAVLLNYLGDADYSTKLKVSFALHKTQLLVYALLLLLLAILVQYYPIKSIPADDIPKQIKVVFRFLAILWWGWSIWLHSKQIQKLAYWLDKSRDQYLSIHLPIFVWDFKTESWHEITLKELKQPFIGSYGVETEKLLVLINTTLLAIYLTSFGIL